jgi:hypothetical protein
MEQENLENRRQRKSILVLNIICRTTTAAHTARTYNLTITEIEVVIGRNIVK